MADNDNTNELDSDIIVTAIQFWKKVYDEKDVTIRYIKNNGDPRIMRCTLDFTKIPEKSRPKSVNIQQILKLIQKNKIMHVFDLEKKEWRSVPFDRVEWLDTKGKRYYVMQMKRK